MNITYQNDQRSQAKRKLSGQTASSAQSSSTKEASKPSSLVCCYECLTDRRSQVLVGKFSQKEFSLKLNAKAINWIVTTCWVNNFDSQALYLAIILFYCYKANHKIQKSKLQLLLITLVYVSSKKNRYSKLRIFEAQQLGQKHYSTEQIVEMEAELLAVLDFNLQFDISISELLWSRQIEYQNLQKLLFLNQLALYTSCQILFNRKMCQQLLDSIEQQIYSSKYLKQFSKNIKLTQVQILKKKYSSKFNVQAFIKKYLTIFQ